MKSTYVLLLLLICAASAHPQPWGPLEITSANRSEQTLLAPKIAIIDTHMARLFFSFNTFGRSEIRTVLLNLTNSHIIGSQTLRSDTGSLRFLDAAAENMSAWIALFEVRINSNWLHTKYILGPTGNASEGLIGVTGSPSVPWLPSYYLTDYDLVPRIGGGWILTWVQVTISGPYQ